MVKKKKISTEKSISLEDTIIFRELQKRNIRLLITAILLLITGFLSLFPVFSDKSIFFLVVAGIFLAISIYQFILIFRRNENIFHHPDMKRFLEWGEDYGNYAITMDEELKQDKKTEFSNAFFTNSFVFIPSFYRFKWFHFSEVCWAFNHVTQNSVNFIPTGKDYAVHIYLDNGSLIEIKSDSSGEILNHLVKTAPFAHYTYSDELKRAWSKDTVNFINSVKHRMQEFLKNPDKWNKYKSTKSKDDRTIAIIQF